MKLSQFTESQTPFLVYIASDVRSGSTLLDMLLGGHPEVESVGEIQFLYDHFARQGTGYSWDWLCTCGKKFGDCPFWTKIETGVKKVNGKSIDTMETWVKRSPQFYPFLLLPHGRIDQLQHKNKAMKFGFEAAQNCWIVIDEIYKQTGKKIIVDSSKTAEQFRFLQLLRPSHVKMIHLIRDGRGVVYSKMTRADDSARKAAKNWVLENVKISLCKFLIPSKQKITIKYEDLCQSPQKTINRILSFLNLNPSDAILSKYDRHNVGGSPHRFDRATIQIRLDERWKTNLVGKDLNTFKTIGGWLNFLMGYR